VVEVVLWGASAVVLLLSIDVLTLHQFHGSHGSHHFSSATYDHNGVCQTYSSWATNEQHPDGFHQFLSLDRNGVPAPGMTFNVSATKDLHLFVEPPAQHMGGVIIVTEDDLEGREDIGVSVFMPEMRDGEEPTIRTCDMFKKRENADGSATVLVSALGTFYTKFLRC
jgi:hypothetical protein